jgi:tetratricopeptide (TPR) repeat protein
MATRKPPPPTPPRANLPKRAAPAPIKLKKTRKLGEITEVPAPTPTQLARAQQANAKITRFDPTDVEAFLRGYVTLGELQGISKPEQYEMAKTGWTLLSEGKVDKAIQVFTGLAALDPYDAYFLTALGSAHQQKNLLAEAERFYTRALEINPYSTTARAHRGEVRALLQRPLDAITDLKRAVQEDPDGKDPAVQRARVMLASIAKELEVTAPARPKSPAKPGPPIPRR